MSDSTLKPCPFYGAQPERVYKSTGQTTHIECPGCKAQFPKSTGENKYDDEWNSRVERTCKREPVEGVSGVCSVCGASLPEYMGWRYCPMCGARVVSE